MNDTIKIGWGRRYGSRYEVIGTECCLFTGDVTEPLERYRFLTEEAARLCANIFNRDLVRYEQPRLSLIVDGSGTITGMNISACSRYFGSEGRVYLSVSQGGAIEKIDVPYFVWMWLRTTAVGRITKALWYGRRGGA